ncbi:A/G-specific adenine glycosylase [Alginatibacterium sediminis]|uniref:Adenine DNA glycosylase n=2 Tax=Alginatibacterium sediminis TaxID=2164068 RepID=A0A420E8D6_9ALTE|nr:A/G-specific adenine glycosylase [Alginatibacterium sediminis]
MPHVQASDFQKILLNWAQSQGRHDLPWQIDPSPYRVLVSEIMLQQTQVATVIPYFERWMKLFPTLKDLAIASEDEVMSLWQGLGYYSRARNLQKAARYIIDDCGGDFPSELEDLEAIPGVGRYTAGAIRSFAYDHYGPIVDGNVRRLFSRVFAIEGLANQSAYQKQLWFIAEHLSPAQNCRDFAQALLDMGATLCKAKSPACERCPLQQDCLAYQQQQVALFPSPKPKKVLPLRHETYLWVEQQQQLLLVKRPSPGIWAGLWCLPQLEATTVLEPKASDLSFQHTFSHYKLKASVRHQQSIPPSELDTRWLNKDELVNVGLATPIRKLIEKHWR